MVDGFESRPHLINFLQARRGERAPENEASFKACRWWRRKMMAHPCFTVPKPIFFKCCGLRCWHTIEGDDSSPLLFSVAGRWGFKIRRLLSLDCDPRFYSGGFRSPPFFPPGNKFQFCWNLLRIKTKATFVIWKKGNEGDEKKREKRGGNSRPSISFLFPLFPSNQT